MCAVCFGLEIGSVACCPHVCGMYSCALWLLSILLIITCPPAPPLPPQPVFISSEHVKVDLFPEDEDGGTTVESNFSD